MAVEKSKQIPIVCPGHTRPLAELQFCHVEEESRDLLVSACHGAFGIVGYACQRGLGEPFIRIVAAP